PPPLIELDLANARERIGGNDLAGAGSPRARLCVAREPIVTDGRGEAEAAQVPAHRETRAPSAEVEGEVSQRPRIGGTRIDEKARPLFQRVAGAPTRSGD